ncbi:MAG: serine/threonine-protein kinase [Gemmataceae bacterium]|nr:serine/threonine-protein kinase [Gemmataceae bacterium]
MNVDKSPSLEEAWANWLAAQDELLAGEKPAAGADPAGPPSAPPAQLERDRDYLQQVRQLLGPSAQANTSSEETALPWRQLGRFQVRRELGRGGFGLVFLAYDPALQREVALKVPRAEALAMPEWRERFQREARAASALEHPHLVPVYEVGEVGPVCFLVSAYCPGPTLATWLKDQREPVPFRLAAGLIATLAEAVQHAHDRGVVHRDLKPSNVLLTPGSWRGPNAAELPWVPRITDFGLAKLLLPSTGATATQSGAIVGTPQYMAPEQAAGKSRAVGPAADVYALGAILYELLTGRPPFVGETDLDTLLQVQGDDPVAPSRLRPGLPGDLATVCLKALAKEPARRYATAQELAGDLRRWLTGEPIRARPVSARERVWAWAKRRPAAAALLVVSGVAVLALSGLVTGAFYNARLDEQLQETEREKRRAEDAQRQAERFQYYHLIARAQADWRDGNLGRVEQLLNDCPAEQRGWEWRYLQRQCHMELFTLPDLAGGGQYRALSPDGSHLAAAGDDDKVRIWDLATGQLFQTLTIPGHPHTVNAVAFNAVAYSPDGTCLAAGYGYRPTQHVAVWEVTTGQRLQTLEGGGQFCLAFSPDGKRLAAVRNEQVLVWGLVTRQPTRTLHHPGWLRGLAFSPDGTHLASTGFDGTVRLWDARLGTEVSPLVALLAPAPVLVGLASHVALATVGIPLYVASQ